MKLVAINGSPKGKTSNTNVMVSAFLKGAQTAGAETANIFLAEKEVKECQGCLYCWTNTPGQCVIKDDMTEILSLEEGANILVLATPLYADHVSGMLKTFLDRRFVKFDPHLLKESNEECRHGNPDNNCSPFRSGAIPAKLVIMANCGYPERSHFQALNSWVKRLARNNATEVLGEIYLSQGILLNAPEDFLQIFAGNYPSILDNISNYRKFLEQAGKEITIYNKLSVETEKMLAQKLMPDDIYIRLLNRIADGMVPKTQSYA